MEVVGDWPTARYTVICILLPEEVTLLAFSEWLAPCSMMTICSIRLVAQKTCQFVFCFILGPMCILSYCRERHWIRSKHMQKRRRQKDMPHPRNLFTAAEAQSFSWCLHAAAGTHERPTSMFRKSKSESLRSLVEEKVPISGNDFGLLESWGHGCKIPEFGCCFP